MGKEAFEELWHTINRLGVIIFVIFMGVAGKVGLYLIGDKKLSGRQLFGSLLISFSIGCSSAIICKQIFPSPPGSISYNSVGIIVLSCIFSDRLLIFIMSADKNKLFEVLATRDWKAIIKILTRKEKEK